VVVAEVVLKESRVHKESRVYRVEQFKGCRDWQAPHKVPQVVKAFREFKECKAPQFKEHRD
jgi:hypothetical protein